MKIAHILLRSWESKNSANYGQYGFPCMKELSAGVSTLQVIAKAVRPFLTKTVVTVKWMSALVTVLVS
jgi:hypothetical protein